MFYCTILLIFFPLSFDLLSMEIVLQVEYDSKWGIRNQCLCCGVEECVDCPLKLHKAVLFENVEDVRACAGASTINMRDFFNDTPLKKACFIKNAESRYEITKILLSYKPMISASVLVEHIKKYHDREIKLFLDYKVDPNAEMVKVYTSHKIQNVTTALHVAAHTSHFSPSIVDMLLHYGGDINRKDYFGNRPCHYAVKHENSITLKGLFLRGADITLQNNKSETIFHVVAQNIVSSQQQSTEAHSKSTLFLRSLLEDPINVTRTLLLIRKLKNTVLNTLPKQLLYLIADLVDPGCKMLRTTKLKEILLVKDIAGKMAHAYLVELVKGKNNEHQSKLRIQYLDPENYK